MKKQIIINYDFNFKKYLILGIGLTIVFVIKFTIKSIILFLRFVNFILIVCITSYISSIYIYLKYHIQINY